jgi:CMP-N,N'-diacetyllegionaminic acid synthase
MKVLGLVPARGGSKGVPRKNIRLMCGLPLLAYTAEQALKAKTLSRVILSTEDEEIALIGKCSGLEVPFLRPKGLAQDSTPSISVVVHTLLMLQESNENFDAVCLLQPTNPLRRAADIDACVNLLANSDADAVTSVLAVPHEYNPKWVYWLDSENQIRLASGELEPIARRQNLPPAFHRDGSVYVTRTETIFRRASLYGRKTLGYKINPAYSANIDTENDWEQTEKRLSGCQIKKTEKYEVLRNWKTIG